MTDQFDAPPNEKTTTCYGAHGRAAPGVIAMPAIAHHNVMAAAMRNLKTFEICFSVLTVTSTIAYHIEIGQRIPKWLWTVAGGVFSTTGCILYKIKAVNQSESKRIKALEGAMMI